MQKPNLCPLTKPKNAEPPKYMSVVMSIMMTWEAKANVVSSPREFVEKAYSCLSPVPVTPLYTLRCISKKTKVHIVCLV